MRIPVICGPTASGKTSFAAVSYTHLDVYKRQRADFASAFTFVYSRRSGTKAAEMEGQIPEEVQKERIMRLVELVNEKTREKSRAYLGKTTEILVEDFDKKRGLYLGRDEYGRMGYFQSDKDRIGEFVRLKITDASGISLYGEPDGREVHK